MKIQPLNEYVLLRPADAEERSAGGILLPDSAQEKPAEGIVLALPPDAEDDVAIGDRVIYKKYSGEDLRVEGETLKLVPYGDLLAKYVDADEIPD